MDFTVKFDMFYVIELFRDPIMGKRPCWAGNPEVFASRESAQVVADGYDKRPYHRVIVCDKREAESIINSRYLAVQKLIPFWARPVIKE